jgi:hypothetical protein
VSADHADYSASIALPSVVHSVPAARHVISELLRAWSAERFRDRAILLVSELVSNAVKHVGGVAHLVLHVQLSDSLLRVAVADSSLSPPVVRQPGTGDPGGHGLVLVDSLASRWGTDGRGSGKQVWFELRNGPVPA